MTTQATNIGPCPNCGSVLRSEFYSVEQVPAHSVLLLSSRDEAIHYPMGKITLALCATCGFISNTSYDPALQEYAQRYEGTQSYSPTFNAFALDLALNLIDRYDLRGKQIIEIGCGQGEFLTQLCELAGNYGVGFDPAYRGTTSHSSAESRLQFIADFYSERYTAYHGDLVCCKMTLEHIPDPYTFVTNVRHSIGDRFDTVVFFQVPNAAYVLQSLAFWDVYYEHCSYFTDTSLTWLFERCGFEVLSTYTAYAEQYLMIEARPSQSPVTPAAHPADLRTIQQDAARFTEMVSESLAHWQQVICQMKQAGQRVVIWGGGSKGVSFLTTLANQDDIAYVVDINPRKSGTFMAGTGQEIVGPSFLQEYRPDAIVVMNPIYCGEIQALLDQMRVSARLHPVHSLE